MAPCLIVFDEMDTLCPRRDQTSSEGQRRVVSTVLALLDGVDARERVRQCSVQPNPECPFLFPAVFPSFSCALPCDDPVCIGLCGKDITLHRQGTGGIHRCLIQRLKRAETCCSARRSAVPLSSRS